MAPSSTIEHGATKVELVLIDNDESSLQSATAVKICSEHTTPLYIYIVRHQNPTCIMLRSVAGAICRTAFNSSRRRPHAHWGAVCTAATAHRCSSSSATGSSSGRPDTGITVGGKLSKAQMEAVVCSKKFKTWLYLCDTEGDDEDTGLDSVSARACVGAFNCHLRCCLACVECCAWLLMSVVVAWEGGAAILVHAFLWSTRGTHVINCCPDAQITDWLPLLAYVI